MKTVILDSTQSREEVILDFIILELWGGASNAFDPQGSCIPQKIISAQRTKVSRNNRELPADIAGRSDTEKAGLRTPVPNSPH